MERNGRKYTAFFTDVTRGSRDKSGVKYKQVFPLDDRQSRFGRVRRAHLGNFDDHIAKSIPGYNEVQIAVGSAIAQTLPAGSAMVDIGASEGSLVKAVSKVSGGRVRTVALDPNTAMREQFSRNPVKNSVYVLEAFNVEEGWTEEDGTVIKPWKPTERYDLAHEAMTFQFIDSDRDAQVAETKRVLKPDGVAVFEQKFTPEDTAESKADWAKREKLKDEYKSQYFDPATLEKMRIEVLEGRGGKEKAVGMHNLMMPAVEFEAILSKHFKHVVQFWDAGNFKGYVASGNAAKADALVAAIGSTKSKFGLTETPRQARFQLVTPIEQKRLDRVFPEKATARGEFGTDITYRFIKNPTADEFRNIARAIMSLDDLGFVRAIETPDGNIVMWPGIDAIHADVSHIVRGSGERDRRKEYSIDFLEKGVVAGLAERRMRRPSPPPAMQVRNARQ